MNANTEWKISHLICFGLCQVRELMPLCVFPNPVHPIHIFILKPNGEEEDEEEEDGKKETHTYERVFALCSAISSQFI